MPTATSTERGRLAIRLGVDVAVWLVAQEVAALGRAELVEEYPSLGTAIGDTVYNWTSGRPDPNAEGAVEAPDLEGDLRRKHARDEAKARALAADALVPYINPTPELTGRTFEFDRVIETERQATTNKAAAPSLDPTGGLVGPCDGPTASCPFMLARHGSTSLTNMSSTSDLDPSGGLVGPCGGPVASCAPDWRSANRTMFGGMR